jgi:FKBP-type peptidyl-prolyl cis-trans isomerase FkpA
VSKSMRTRLFGALAATCLAATGCEEPPPIVTTPMPGQDYRSALQPDSEEPAQALGEQAGKNADVNKLRTLPGLEPAPPTAPGEVKTTKSGVKYETLKAGSGAEAKAGQNVTVHYVGKLENGKTFDSSRERGKPTVFPIGVGSVVKGWDEAVPGMKVGELRKMTIPPNAGYGALGKKPEIPPNATLVFEIELVDTK